MDPLLEKIIAFHQARDWEKFHSPKNVVMDLASEVGELVDPFRWVTEEESYTLGTKTSVREELGDVYRALVYLAHRLGLDPIECAMEKLDKMEAKYPFEKCYGLAKKYTEYE